MSDFNLNNLNNLDTYLFTVPIDEHFNFFDTNKIIVIEQEYKIKVLNGLAYFAIKTV
jgi:hypothetical protein